jgi:predicted dehydrogenase
MLRLGIIGCGRVTTMFHLNAIKMVEGVTVTAVSDVSEERMRDVRGSCASAKTYTDYIGLLDDPDVDAVAINTPPRFHEEMTFESLNHGKHVLCEKPLAQTVEGCDRIGEEQRRTGLHVLPAHNYAFTPSVLRMVELAKGGAVGEVQRVRVYFENNLRIYRSQTDFRTRQENGIVEDVLPHVLSVSTPLAGRARDVCDLSWWCSQYKVCDNIRATLEAEGGAEVECSLSWTRLVPRFRVEVEGAKGRMETDLMMGPYTVTVWRGGHRETFKERGLGWYLDLAKFRHPSFQGQYRHFAAIVAGDEEPLITVGDEAAMLGVMERVSELLRETPRSR